MERNPCLELSNNIAERCVKPFAVNRKIFKTSGSGARAIYTVKLFSIIRSAIINGLDPYHYIRFVLENIKTSLLMTCCLILKISLKHYNPVFCCPWETNPPLHIGGIFHMGALNNDVYES